MSSKSELQKIMLDLDRMLYASEWEKLDDIFKNLNEKATPTVVVVTVLRYTSSASSKGRFKEWDNLVARTRDHLNELTPGRGDRVLRGLY